MSEHIFSTKPPSDDDIFLVETFRKELTRNLDRFDDLCKEVLKLELAIPGSFAVILKIFSEKGTTPSLIIIIAFVFWLIALSFTVYDLLPKKVDVMKDVPRQEQGLYSQNGKISIEEYYTLAIKRKRICLIGTIVTFFSGTVLAISSLLIGVGA